jgi:type III restriction enzyme
MGDKPAALGEEKSRALWAALHEAGYLDAKGKVTEALKKALDDRALAIPVEFEGVRGAIEELLKHFTKRYSS